MTEEELEKEVLLMEEEGDDTEIIKVLPGIFRRENLYKVEADGRIAARCIERALTGAI